MPQIQAVAKEQQADPTSVADEAFRLYLWEQSKRKIAKETAVYRQQHNELKIHYLGRYIAMYQREVVDSDEDFQALNQRVRQKYGRTPVMITLVDDKPDTTISRHGFQLAS